MCKVLYITRAILFKLLVIIKYHFLSFKVITNVEQQSYQTIKQWRH